MRDGSIFFAIGCMLDSARSWYDRAKVRISKSKPVTGTWRLVYRKWLDDDEQVFRVINWRTAIIKKRGTVRGMTACFWWFQ
jgi:hypothetical protein